jgi:hypothetical protein
VFVLRQIVCLNFATCQIIIKPHFFNFQHEVWSSIPLMYEELSHQSTNVRNVCFFCDKSFGLVLYSVHKEAIFFSEAQHLKFRCSLLSWIYQAAKIWTKKVINPLKYKMLLFWDITFGFNLKFKIATFQFIKQPHIFFLSDARCLKFRCVWAWSH